MGCSNTPAPIRNVKCVNINSRVFDNYIAWLKSIARGTTSYHTARIISLNQTHVLIRLYHRGYRSSFAGYSPGSSEHFVIKHLSPLSSIGGMPVNADHHKTGRLTKADKDDIIKRFDLEFPPHEQHIKLIDL